MKKLSYVTIIMATYNRAHFIVETMLSIQNQTYANWECLIIDDGGTDDTKETITPILEKDTRFQFLQRPSNYKKGLPGCRNYGLDLAEGDFIIFFDDDDFIHPDNLKVCLKVLVNDAIDFCHYQKMPFTNQMPISNKSIVTTQIELSKIDIEKVVRQEIGLASCTVMWRRNCFNQIRFNESLLYAEEWECYIRILTENFKGVIIDAVLYFNRKHSNSNTGEFYSFDSIRRASFVDAVLLVVNNLKEKQLFTDSLIRYFVTIATDYKEYILFGQIIDNLQLPVLAKLKWHFFYITFPIRFLLYRLKKKVKNN